MATIVKTYVITDWVTYSEGPIGDITGMEIAIIPTVIGNHPCLVTSYHNEDGEGFEHRVYTVPDDQCEPA